jgi:hypothetical protein
VNRLYLLPLLALGLGSSAASADGPQASLSSAAEAPQAAQTVLDGAAQKQEGAPVVDVSGDPVIPPSRSAAPPQPIAAAAMNDPAPTPPISSANTTLDTVIGVLVSLALVAAVVALVLALV